jgi:hypothetical protein
MPFHASTSTLKRLKGNGVTEVPASTLTSSQVAFLEGLLKAGFQFTAFEQFARYLAVEKAGFVALLDISGGKVRQFGSVGYPLGSGIGILIERAGGKAFVWKNESVPATPGLLMTYESVKKELDELLVESAKQ